MRWLDGIIESEQTPGDSKGQGSLACYSPWGCKESDNDLATEQHLLGCARFLFQHVGSSSLTRDQTQAPWFGSTESWPPGHQEIPFPYFLRGMSFLAKCISKTCNILLFCAVPLSANPTQLLQRLYDLEDPVLLSQAFL